MFLSIENPKGVNKICIKDQHEHFRKNSRLKTSPIKEPKSILIKARQEKEKFYLINLKMNHSLYQIA